MSDHQFGYSDESRPPVPPPAEPPPWIVSQEPAGGQWPARPPAPTRSRLPLILGAAVLVLIVAVGGGYLVLRRYDVLPSTAPTAQAGDVGDNQQQGDNQPPEDPTYEEVPPATQAAPPTTEPTLEPTTDPEQDALARLDDLAQQDLNRVTLRGQYVAQLASKNPGTTDKFQTTAGGSHTFQATDILQQHQELRDDPANGDTTVVLLKSTDYGIRQLYRGAPLYVTFALGPFASKAAVTRWCGKRFPQLTGEELGNQCAVRRLRPPGS